MIVEINSENYKEIISQTDKPVLVDFYADWCGPCKMLHPVMEKLAEEFADTVIIAKANVEDNRDMGVEYGIMSIPAVIIFNKGEMIGSKMIGVKPKDDYANVLKELV
ncbi:MAG: hypothetical protein RLZZ196_282 [Bacteroidota bacterium]|jgi:thioredoxin 1